MAFVVPTTGVDVDTDELIAWCRENMANYKVPRYVELVDEPAAQRVEQGAQVRAGGAGEAAAGALIRRRYRPEAHRTATKYAS